MLHVSSVAAVASLPLQTQRHPSPIFSMKRPMESSFTEKFHVIKGRKEETPNLLSFIRGLFGWLFSPEKNLFLMIKNTSRREKLSPMLESANSWNDLPEDLVRQIGLKLDIRQFIRMGAVCRSWDSVINLSRDTRRLMQMSFKSKAPWLLQEHSPSSESIHLYYLSEGKRYDFLKPKFMCESFCCGTSNGWSIMVDESEFGHLMYLWNPFTAQIISLPPLSNIPCYIKSLDNGLFNYIIIPNFIKRVEVFSLSAGEKEHVVVAAILGLLPCFGGDGQILVLCNPEEDEDWTVIESDKDIEWYYDILHHNGMLCVVQDDETQDGRFEVCTISLPNCEVTLAFIHAKAYPQRHDGDEEEDRFWLPDPDIVLSKELMGWLHLAESVSGELLLITRTCALIGFFDGEEIIENVCNIYNETSDFKVEVIKFENDKSLFTLTSCTSLSDQALFVGSCGAVASDSEFDQDCIWFLPSELHIHDFLQSKDFGVFYLRDKTIKRCFPSVKAPLPSNLGWFTPKLL